MGLLDVDRQVLTDGQSSRCVSCQTGEHNAQESHCCRCGLVCANQNLGGYVAQDVRSTPSFEGSWPKPELGV